MVHYRFLLPAFININPNYYMIKYAYFQVFSIFARLLNHHQSAFKLYLKLCTPLVLIIHNYRLNRWLSKRGLFLNNPHLFNEISYFLSIWVLIESSFIPSKLYPAMTKGFKNLTCMLEKPSLIRLLTTLQRSRYTASSQSLHLQWCE